jgi:hypothetical protein
VSQTPSFAERLQKAFVPGARGVVGVVDELLAVCGKDAIRFEWKDGGCWGHFPEDVPAAPRGSFWSSLKMLFAPRVATLVPIDSAPARVVRSIQVQLPKSAFRAVLARLAALCNERKPDSVSPYGGAGEIAVGSDPPRVVRVSFTNTPAEQTVTLQLASDTGTNPAAPDARVASPSAT